MGTIALICYILSLLQFLGKGFLLNNAYIYAGKKERDAMDKRPYYRQSAIVFLLIGAIFFANALDAILHTSWLIFVVIGIVFVLLFYAILSSIQIEKAKKNKK